jgi:hypothetical protein
VLLWALVVICLFILILVLLLRLRTDREFTIKATVTKWFNFEVDSRRGGENKPDRHGS